MNIQKILDEGLREGVYTAASAAIGGADRKTELFVAGCAPKTLFDLASLTKVFVTTAIARLGSTLTQDLRDLLAHQAGYEAWVDFHERGKKNKAEILADLKTIPMAYPRGEETRYSDLGFIVLGEEISKVTGSPIDGYLQNQVIKPLKLTSITFNPLDKHSPEEIAPTEDISWRGGVVRGQVHDDNAFLMGGVSAHTGLFGTAEDVLKLGIEWLSALSGRSKLLSKEVAEEFTTPIPTKKGPTRALGWDLPSFPKSLAGTKMSKHTFGHLGYTGTSIWIDPEKDAAVVLLTNRVHPTSKNEKIREFRPIFYDAAWENLRG